MAGQGEVLLQFVKIRALNNRERVFLAVDDAIETAGAPNASNIVNRIRDVSLRKRIPARSSIVVIGRTLLVKWRKPFSQ